MECVCEDEWDQVRASLIVCVCLMFRCNSQLLSQLCCSPSHLPKQCVCVFVDTDGIVTSKTKAHKGPRRCKIPKKKM